MGYTKKNKIILGIIYPYLKTGLEVIYKYKGIDVISKNILKTDEVVYCKYSWKKIRVLLKGGNRDYSLKPVLYPRQYIIHYLKEIDKNTLSLKDLDKLLCFVDTGDINLLNKLPYDVVMRIYDQQIDIHGLIDNRLAISKTNSQ